MTFETGSRSGSILRFLKDTGYLILASLAFLVCVGGIMFATAESWAGWAPSVFSAAHNYSVLFGGIVGVFFFSTRGLKAQAFSPVEADAAGNNYSPEWTRPTRLISPRVIWIAIYWGIFCAFVPSILALAVNGYVYDSRIMHNANWPVWFAWAFGTCALVCSLTILGAVLGTKLPVHYSLPLSGMLGYLVAWTPVLTELPNGAHMLAGYVDFLWFFYEPTLYIAFLRWCLWAGFGSVILSFGIRNITWGVIGLILCLAGLSPMLGKADNLQPVSDAFGVECIDENPVVCTPMPFASSLDTLNEYMRPGIELLPASYLPEVVGTHRFVNPIVSGDQLLVDPNARESFPSNVPTRVDVTASLAHLHIARHCSSLSGAPVETVAPFLAFMYKATDGEFPLTNTSTNARLIPPGTDLNRALPEARRLAALSDREFTAYLSTNFDTIQSCGSAR